MVDSKVIDVCKKFMDSTKGLTKREQYVILNSWGITNAELYEVGFTKEEISCFKLRHSNGGERKDIKKMLDIARRKFHENIDG